MTSGQFLLDSESQLQEALGKLVMGSRGHTGDHRHELWSCPMHPDIVQEAPGRCPECGMDLEAREGTEAERAALAGVDAEGAYTCPMHPAVVQEGPGRCPDCGMFLEPMGAAAEPAATEPAATEAPAGAWHCPEHPGIPAQAPGACIVCGADLVETHGAHE